MELCCLIYSASCWGSLTHSQFLTMINTMLVVWAFVATREHQWVTYIPYHIQWVQDLASTLNPSLLLKYVLGGSIDSPSNWVCTTHRGFSSQFQVSLWYSPGYNGHLGRTPVLKTSSSACPSGLLCFSNKWNKVKILNRSEWIKDQKPSNY